MDRQARIKSVDAVPELAAAVQNFAEEARAALVGLDLEIGRTVDWVQRGQRAYWSEQIRRGRDKVTEAQSALDLAETVKRTDERRPSCWEERKRLDAAKRQVRLAEAKLETVAHWARELDHEVIEYRGSMAQLAGWLESEFPRAAAALDRMTLALESYVGLARSPEEQPQPPQEQQQQQQPQQQQQLPAE